MYVIVALLILIVFILLFGAAAVKGFLANVASLAAGLVVLIGLLMWVGSFFGPDGFAYVVFGTMGLLLVFAIFVSATSPASGKGVVSNGPKSKPINRYYTSQAPSREDRKRLRESHRVGPRIGKRG